MSEFVVLVLAVALATFLIGFIINVVNSTRRLHQFRAGLHARIDSLPFSRMLQRRGIDQNRYVATQPVNAIHEHIHNCEDCAIREGCDPLKQDVEDQCPNTTPLTVVKVKLAGDA